MGSLAYGLVAAVSEVCKIFWRDSDVMARNMVISFEDFATVAWRFLTFMCPSRILPLPLTTLLLVI
jgi:hypothetical protein